MQCIFRLKPSSRDGAGSRDRGDGGDGRWPQSLHSLPLNHLFSAFALGLSWITTYAPCLSLPIVAGLDTVCQALADHLCRLGRWYGRPLTEWRSELWVLPKHATRHVSCPINLSSRAPSIVLILDI